jgi:hypothetical protein
MHSFADFADSAGVEIVQRFGMGQNGGAEDTQRELHGFDLIDGVSHRSFRRESLPQNNIN